MRDTIEIKLNKETLKKLVLDHLQKQLGDIPLETKHVCIETKSQQNYKSEWEQADFRASITINL